MRGIAVAVLFASCSTDTQPRVSERVGSLDVVREDLVVPELRDGAPRAGVRVRVTAPEYAGTDVYHTLYLPRDWQAGREYPVLVEYAGNGPYRNRLGDVSTGRVEDSCLGYGISGGRGFLWLCLPYVDKTGTRNERKWWGSLERTVEYCKTVVPRVCKAFGGDEDRVVLVGFSRGAIACNYIGLHDDEIASLWTAFVCHSHYDGVRRWPYADSDRRAAARRLARLGDRPQWISHEQSVSETAAYLRDAYPSGRFTFAVLPFVNHTDRWVLRDVPMRSQMRLWLRAVLR